MTNFGVKNFSGSSNIVPDNSVKTPFSNAPKLKPSQNISSANTLNQSDNLKKDSVSNNSNTAFSQSNSSTLARLNSRTTLSREDLMVSAPLPNLTQELNIEGKKNIPDKQQPKAFKPIASKPVTIKPEDILKERFDDLTVEAIKKFPDSAYSPYPKEYKCSSNQAIIEHTSLIEDFECSSIYGKTPFNLAISIFDDPKVKSDPELKTKISSFVALLGQSDKAGLAYTKTLLDRKPPLADETVKNLLDKLTSMLNSSYDARIGDKKEFVVSALHDIAVPSDISQEGIGTCAGTSVQIQMSIRNPAEYLKMIDTLAKNENYTTVKGFTVQPNFTFSNESKTTHDTGRTISAKIMQNTIMDYADAETRNFDSSKNDAGITTTQTVKALNDIVGLNVESNYTWNYTGEQLLDLLKKSEPSRSNPVEISLSYEPQGRDALHSVNVVSLDANNVTISNPWGREETFPVAELNSRILSVSSPVSLDKNLMSISARDNSIKARIANDSTKQEVLSKITINDKSELIQENIAPWNGQKFALKDNVSEADKKMILNILDELTQGGYAQNKVWLPRIKHFAPDLNLFLSKLDNNTEQFNKVKEKITALNS